MSDNQPLINRHYSISSARPINKMEDYQNDLTPTAATTHICDECRGLIQIGEKYHASYGIDDNDFFSFRLCPCCYNTLREINSTREDEDEVFVGEVAQHFENGESPELKAQFEENKAQRQEAYRQMKEVAHQE